MAALDAELQRGRRHVVIDADTENLASVDEAICVIAGSCDAQCDIAGCRTHHDCRRAAIGRDFGSTFIGVRQTVAVTICIVAVLDAVAVIIFVAVLDAVPVVVAVDPIGAVAWSSVEQHALGDIGADAHGGAALKQVVSVKVFEEQDLGRNCAAGRLIVGARGVAVSR
ncbi:hypothetical protein D3C87_1296780 [compost metagenome]